MIVFPQPKPSFLPPLLIPTCTLIAGISLASGFLAGTFTLLPVAIITATLGFMAFYTALKNPHQIVILILATCMYIAGIGRVYFFQQTTEPLPSWKTPVTLNGIVYNISLNYDSRMRQCTQLSIQSLAPSDNSTNKTTLNQTILIYSPLLIGIDVGDTVEIQSVTFKEIDNIDYKKYLAKEGIAATLFLQNPNYILLKRPYLSVNRALFHQKMRIFNTLRKKIDRKTFTLFATLFLGERTYNKQYITSLSGQFQYWGLMHYLARSGLHMVIFAATWEFLFRMLPISFLVRQVILLLFYILYFILSWPSIPFIRAFLTVMLYKTCIFSKRPTHFFAALPLICCAVLLYNPLQLLFLDFQLSFLLTFALGWFNYTTRNTN